MPNAERLAYSEIQPQRSFRTEVVGSKAFNLEYDPGVFEKELKDEVISYLGEYRFQLPKFEYQLLFSGETKASQKLRDTHREEPMQVKAKLAIEERKSRGGSIQREEAELRGITRAEDKLRFAEIGDSLVWISPPGSKEEGYGDYGFIYLGNLVENSGRSFLKMEAIRVENPSLEKFNHLLTDISGREIIYETAEEFLRGPEVVGKNKSQIEKNIQNHFPPTKNKGSQEIFEEVMKKMEPVINEFTYFVKHGTRDQKLKAFNALEIYALKLKEEHSSFQKTVYEIDNYKSPLQLIDVVALYGNQKAPVVSGSCGSTKSEIKSNDIFKSNYSILRKNIFGEEEKEWFKCPKCDYQADGPVGHMCPNCGLTKEEYAEKSGITCG